MQNEQKLIAGCQKGKRNAQKQLYEMYSNSMFVVSLRYAKGRLEAEDILQESFIKVFEKIKSFRGEVPLEFWIKRIVINTALNHERSKLYQYPSHDITEMDNQLPDAEVILSSYNFKELLAMVQQLPDRAQVVFNLYAIEGYQHKEIAEMLNITEGTSKSQYARAKLLLQEMIKKHETVQ